MIIQPPNLSKCEVRVAGADLVLRKTGVCRIMNGALDTHIINGAKLRGGERLDFIWKELETHIFDHQPQLVVLEDYAYDAEYGGQHLGEVSGLLKLLSYRNGVPLLLVAPKQLKVFVSGSGDASKKKMVACVEKFYGVTTKSNDIADAVGLAKIGEVYLTGDSERRCELEIIRRLKTPKAKAKNTYKKYKVSV